MTKKTWRDNPNIWASSDSAPPTLDVERLVVAAMLPDPEGEGWGENVVITKRDLHDLLNKHAETRIRDAYARLAQDRSPDGER